MSSLWFACGNHLALTVLLHRTIDPLSSPLSLIPVLVSPPVMTVSNPCDALLLVLRPFWFDVTDVFVLVVTFASSLVVLLVFLVVFAVFLRRHIRLPSLLLPLLFNSVLVLVFVFVFVLVFVLVLVFARLWLLGSAPAEVCSK